MYDNDVNEGFEKVEQEPDIDHLDVGGVGQPGADAYTHREFLQRFQSCGVVAGGHG